VKDDLAQPARGRLRHHATTTPVAWILGGGRGEADVSAPDRQRHVPSLGVRSRLGVPHDLAVLVDTDPRYGFEWNRQVVARAFFLPSSS